MSQRLLFISFLIWVSSPSLWAQSSYAQQYKASLVMQGFTFPIGNPADSMTITFSKGDEQSRLSASGPRTMWVGETYPKNFYSDIVITFSKPVTMADFNISHFNNDENGTEDLRNLQVYTADQKMITPSISWTGNPLRTTFNPKTHVIKGTPGSWGPEASGRLIITSSTPFTTITFSQVVITGIPNGLLFNETVDFTVMTTDSVLRKQRIETEESTTVFTLPKKEIVLDSVSQQLQALTIEADSLSDTLASTTSIEKTDSITKPAGKAVIPAVEKKTTAKKPASTKLPEKKPAPQSMAKPTPVKPKSATKPVPKKAVAVQKPTPIKPKPENKPVEKPKPKKTETPTQTYDMAQVYRLSVGDKIKLNHVFFKQSLPELLPESYLQLDSLVMILKQYPTLHIELQGHTDNQGDAGKNLILSEQRVAVVKEYLVVKGIVTERLTTKGMGMMEPRMPNDTEENRKLNRRVEFVITNK